MSDITLGTVAWRMPIVPHSHAIEYRQLWHYFEPSPTSMDQYLAGVRWFMTKRKPWKNVNPYWLQHVLDYFHIKLEYDWPVEVPTWKARCFGVENASPQYGRTYAGRDLAPRINYIGVTDIAVARMIEQYDYHFMVIRKEWKVLSKAHVEQLVRNLGGEPV